MVLTASNQNMLDATLMMKMSGIPSRVVSISLSMIFFQFTGEWPLV